MTQLLDNRTDDQELRTLIAAVCNGVASPVERERLEELLADDEEAQMTYLLFAGVHAHFLWQYQGQTNEIVKLAADSHTPPPLGFLGEAYQGTVGYFSSGWPVAYLVATVILGVGLLVGGITHVSPPVQTAQQTVPRPSPLAPGPSPKMEFVGRITGMIDCQWADRETAVIGPVAVPLGRKYALASGLMEITYDTGAKVILQGPCTYEVESRAGGFLSVGKLTARVEKRGERRGERGEDETVQSTEYGVRSSGTEGESSVQHSTFRIQHSSANPLFFVRTPTAIVTDLGTEFGVEVSREGHTTSHVFRGSVELRLVPVAGQTESAGQVLHQNESARVERDAEGEGNRLVTVAASVKSANFVRKLVRPTIKTLDLVDVVAGGDGFSDRRNAGIDPTTGRVANEPARVTHMYGDGKYHRVEALPFVDGVFVPDGRMGDVQVDSAGHTFTGFPASLENEPNTAGYLWAGYVPPATEGEVVMSATLRDVDYASTGHGALMMHANKAITFDLDAIRRANPGQNLARFRTMAGNTETMSGNSASVRGDIWVIVDGQARFQRQKINSSNGAFSIVIPITDGDRFLTLAATDGGNGMGWDWILFGDPRLEMISQPSEDNKQEAR